MTETEKTAERNRIIHHVAAAFRVEVLKRLKVSGPISSREFLLRTIRLLGGTYESRKIAITTGVPLLRVMPDNSFFLFNLDTTFNESDRERHNLKIAEGIGIYLLGHEHGTEAWYPRYPLSYIENEPYRTFARSVLMPYSTTVKAISLSESPQKAIDILQRIYDLSKSEISDRIKEIGSWFPKSDIVTPVTRLRPEAESKSKSNDDEAESLSAITVPRQAHHLPAVAVLPEAKTAKEKE